jgi:PPK2 family polyphosphate:nucleotide phosphotransferase
MKIKIADFRIPQGKPVDLKSLPTKVKDFYESKDEYKDVLQQNVEELSSLQEALFAANQYSLLVIVQGMDTSGKDGVVSHTLSGVNPVGIQVSSFKQPSAEELDHDFLWRTTARLPERGKIGVFIRSYYEEVIVVRVHPEFLLGQHLPAILIHSTDIWQDRFRSIIEHENHLVRNGTQVVKIFLHLSKDEQRQRLLDRLNEPDKNWKFNPGDVAERQLWDQYMAAYEACLSETSAQAAPWYAVPADDKKNARLIVSEIILETLRNLKSEYPKADAARSEKLALSKKQLESES